MNGGLTVGEGNDCRAAVITFLSNKLNVNIAANDIEVDNFIPTRPAENENTQPTQLSAETTWTSRCHCTVPKT